MPVIYFGLKEGGIGVYDPDKGMKTGRWCAAPQEPDLCETCYDRKTFAHYPAEGYIEDFVDQNGTVWRSGVCHRCAHKYKDKKIFWYKKER